MDAYVRAVRAISRVRDKPHPEFLFLNQRLGYILLRIIYSGNSILIDLIDLNVL